MANEIPMKRERVPDVNEIGGELEGAKLVVKRGNSYSQFTNNCYDIASRISDKLGYEMPSRREIRDYVEMRKRMGMIKGWIKRGIPGTEPLNIKDYEYKLQPSLSYLIVRIPDEDGCAHVSFEFIRREYNYGARGDDNAPILMKIPLQKTNR
ncbi:MAG: hypothetical protein AABW50_02770 [Nanoarchaeota archaeon]